MECQIVYRRVRPLLDRKVTVPSVYRLVGRSVSQSVSQSISRKAVSKKKRKEYIPVGRDNEKEESRRLDIYRKMPRH